MRKLVDTQNITVDGSIEMLGEWFDPQGQGDMSDMMEAMEEHRGTADAMLSGRRTFEDMRGYWPQQSDDTTGVTEYLNNVVKYVVSSTMTDAGWQNSTVLSGDPVENVRGLKQRVGKDIVLTGSITLSHALIAAGLVDEFRLFVYPVVQGRGRRLFPDGYEIPRMQLLDARSFASGITMLVYAPRGSA